VHGPVTPTEFTQWRGRAFLPFAVLRPIIATNRGFKMRRCVDRLSRHPGSGRWWAQREQDRIHSQSL